MSGIRSRGRRGSTIVPNWRWEDTRLDPYDLRVAGWLASHADSYLAEHVSRNEICRILGLSPSRVTKSLENLEALGIILVEHVNRGTNYYRWVIEFDWEVWETEPVTGSHATAPPVAPLPPAGSPATGSIGEQEEGRELSKESSRGELELVRERPRNELFDACVEACGWDYSEMTERQRKACGVAVGQLKGVGATPDEVRRRSLVYRQVYPEAALTPNALANQWAAIGRIPDKGPSLSRGGQAVMRGYQRALEREANGGGR